MTTAPQIGASRSTTVFLRRPALACFLLTFAISWTGALLLVLPRLLHGQSIPKFTGLMMFPVMLVGPAVSGLIMTWIGGRRPALRGLAARMRCLRIPPRWYAALLLPPFLVFTTLTLLRSFVSPIFAPGHFFPGIAFGLVAGFFEEIGWTGFAFPAMIRTRAAFGAAVLLGLLWGLWHAPVVDFLGAATPHRAWWLPFFAAFIAAMTAMRVLIAWIYANTGSVALAQLMHASSTASLVVFSPFGVTPGQEALWYAAYAVVLWCFVALVRARFGPALLRA